MQFLRFSFAMTACFAPAALLAQRAPLPQYLPDRAAIAEAYKQSVILDSSMRHLPLVRPGRPHWASDGHSFWYTDVGADSTKAYFAVNMQTGKREALAGKPNDTSIDRTGFTEPPSRWDDPTVDTTAPTGGGPSFSGEAIFGCTM